MKMSRSKRGYFQLEEIDDYMSMTLRNPQKTKASNIPTSSK